ncbi:MAG: hypothetical protein CHACPFDD_02506 [Phycisphaerae bacterium]|nr:hypothetical protein [Phycisphaerae bacterium]
MAVVSVNLARVSNNLRSFQLLQTVRWNQTGLFGVQNQLATGLRFAAPSEIPLAAARALAIDHELDKISQVSTNLQTANSSLTATEAAMQDALDLLLNARALASENVSETSSAAQRESAAVVIDSIIDGLIDAGNRRHVGDFLFSGHRTGDSPFELQEGGVLFRGDGGTARSIVDSDLSQDAFKIPGLEFFNAESAGVQGFVDLDPAISLATRLSDLRGASGAGIRLATVSVSDGTQTSLVDLSGAATVGDILDKLNANMPPTLVATIDNRGVIISSIASGTTISVDDVGGGQAARDLGIYTPGSTTSTTPADLDPKLTPRTPLFDLMAGFGVDLSNGLVIRNGGRSATLSFNDAETLENVLNVINASDMGVRAEIAPDGRSMNVVNRLSGGDLSIEENGGAAATALGIRSLRSATALADLNDGRGVQTVEGDDIRIVTRSGAQVDVDIDGALTIQDVLDRFNAAGAGLITAALASTGNGIVITDLTSGAGQLRAERLNLSPALGDLGLDHPAVGGTLRGDDVNPQRVSSAFTALLELRVALRADDTRGIAAAALRLDETLAKMQETQGKAASLAKSMLDREARLENSQTAARVMLSDVRDVDISEAVVRFQQFENALQANLATASRIMSLSLIDYLR